MAVLVLIGVTLYSLSAVATKSADIAKARTEAQANAKAALMLAIGELQKNTGPDTRVTAPADIITDPANPDDNTRTLKVIGAWKSWEGLNHDPDEDGRPITPDYTIKEISSNSTNARFLSWLVSDTEFDAANNEFIYPRNEPDGNTVPLLATGKDNNPEDGSLQDGDSNEIHVRPRITDNNGRYAWWVSPENQKARLIQPYEPRTNDSEGWMEMGQSHLVPDPTVFGFDSLLNNPEPFNPITATTGNTVKKAINRDALALVDPANPGEPHKRFHDLSTSAVGLLTNTATGGWRKDLSILTEKW